MAIYYMNVQIISRSAGRTASGAAAYRAGERIVDERTGQVFDYTRRRGEIETEILAPEGAPAWAQDRGQLWNRAEAAERRGDAQVAREMVVAFPKELNADQQWAVAANRALEKAGREERIDYRSLAEQGMERLPEVHLGPHSAALERRGVSTEKGEHNRLVAEHNAVVIDLEKAREGKRQIQVQKSVAERYNDRTRAGWLPVHAQAVAKLEYSLGGGELTYGETADLAENYRSERQGIEQQVRAIQQEGERLD